METHPPDSEAGKKRFDVPLYYRVATCFWDDEKARRWPDHITVLALYILTTRHRTLEGFFILPVGYIAEDLSVSRRRVRVGLTILEKDGFIEYDHDTSAILIRNALRYQQPDSTNVVRGVISRVKSLPQSKLLIKFIALAKLHCLRKGLSPSAQSFPHLLEQELPHLSEQELQQEHVLLNPNLQSGIVNRESINRESLKNSTFTEKTKHLRTVGRVENDTGEGLTQTEASLRERWPHLKDTK